MSASHRKTIVSAEWWLVILVPVFAVVAGAAMIHVSSSFGFTALGEPAAIEVHGG